MAAYANLTRRLSALVCKTNKARRDSNRRRLGAHFEILEQRQLLAGLVMDESVFDVGQFAANLEEQVPVDTTGPNGVVGYSYAIVDGDPDNPITGAEGNRRMSWDGPFGIALPASPTRTQEIASVSKIITGAAIMHLLQEQTNSIQQMEAMLDNVSIAFFVPSNWNTTAAFNSISVRELLTHTSGIRDAAVSGYNYASLQSFAQTGTLAAKVPAYSTYNFSFFRVMLPYMWSDVNSSELNANAVSGLLDLTNLSPSPGLNTQLRNAIVADWNPAVDSNDIASISPDRVTASIYKFYVSEYILEPSGIENPQTRSTGAFSTLLYPLDPTIVPGTDFWGPSIPTQVVGLNTGDQTLNAAPRGWNLSAIDVARFLTGIRHGATDGSLILEENTLALMDAGGLGWQHSTSTGLVGDFGQYYGHDGANFRPDPPTSPGVPSNARLGPMNNTVAIAFPNGVEAALLINSQIQSVDRPAASATPRVIGGAFNPGGGGTGTIAALRNAYDHAWTDLVFEGNAGAVLGADQFLLTTNPIDAEYIDFVFTSFLGNVQTITRRHDTLDSLVINGLGGNDVLTLTNLPSDLQLQITFNSGAGNDSVQLRDLPAGVELIFNGGAGSDSLQVAHTTRDLDWIQGTVTFNGGFGTDTLVVDDRNDFILTTTPDPNAKVRTYDVAATTVARSGVGQIVEYHSVQTVELHSSAQSNQININSTALGTDVEINAGIGNDLIVLGDGNASGNLNGGIQVNPGAGNDELVIDDSNGAIADDTYVFHANYFQSQFIDVIEWADDQTRPNTIRFLASNHASTIHVRDVLSNVTLHVNGRGGGDDMSVHAVALAGHLVLDGGAGDDTFTFTPETGDLDAIRGQVVVNGAGAFDRIYLHAEQGAPASSGRNYRLVDMGSLTNIIGTFDIIGGGSLFGLLTYHGSTVETLEIQGSAGADTFDVRSTSGPILSSGTRVNMHGNGENDTVVVAEQSQNLGAISGELYFAGGAGFDMVRLHDQNDIGNDVYNVAIGLFPQVTKGGFELVHAGVEELTLNANLGNNQINVVPSISLPGSFVDTAYIINGGTGNDTVTVTASALAHVTVNGGAGGDLVEIVGNAQDNEFVLNGNQIRYGGTTVVFGPTVERRRLDGGGGLDVLVVEGRAGVSETFHVQATTTPGSGHLLPNPFPRLDFVNLEDVDVHGNPGGGDRLIFAGTDGNDLFDVNPIAQGTASDPVVNLHQGAGVSLLRLRNNVDVGSALIRGGTGDDTFRVFLMPTQPVFPMRNMRLDGGPQPTGGSGDTLIVSYNPNFFQLLGEPPSTPNGQLRFDHSTDIIDLVFSDFEQLVL